MMPGRTFKHVGAWLRRFVADDRAAAAAEMAIVFPIFGFVSLNIMDLCVYMYQRMQTEHAAQAAVGLVRNICDTAAKLPATNPAGHCDATLTQKMTAAAQATSLGNKVTLSTPVEGYYCANTSDTLQLVAAVTASPPATCSSVVSGSTVAPGNYISVRANFTYVPFAPGLSIMSLISTNVQRTAWMRLR